MTKVILNLMKSFFKCAVWLGNLISDLLFPKYCIICGSMLPLTQKFCICAKCEPDVKYMASVCVDESTGCDEVISGLEYCGNVRQAMLKFKFQDLKYIGYTFAKVIFQKVKNRAFINGNTIVTAVPIHIARDREYNQAEVIARELCKELGLSYTDGIIYKIKPIERLSAMDKQDKYFFTKESFMINPTVNLTGKTIIVVDDIFTTGATLKTISGELKKHGAEHVYALTACYSKPK